MRATDMTIKEASEKYHIPLELLREYERWGLCDTVKKVMGAWQYDDRDLERLSMIMTLHDAGFTGEEVKTYMQLILSGTDTTAKRLQLLKHKRDCILKAIHRRERQLDQLDHLRYKMQKEDLSR